MFLPLPSGIFKMDRLRGKFNLAVHGGFWTKEKRSNGN